MIKAAFYFEDYRNNISSGLPEATVDRWLVSAKGFGCNTIVMIDLSTYKMGKYYNHADSEIDFEYYTSTRNAENNHVNYNIVILENADTFIAANVSYSELTDFVHPTSNVVYLTGADSGVIDFFSESPSANCNNTIHWVSIDTYNNTIIWAENAMAITLHDRFKKLG